MLYSHSCHITSTLRHRAYPTISNNFYISHDAGKLVHNPPHRLIDIDIDLIRLGGLIGPICRSITSVLDSCLVKKHAGTLLPQMLYYVRAFHLLNRCSAIYMCLYQCWSSLDLRLFTDGDDITLSGNEFQFLITLLLKQCCRIVLLHLRFSNFIL